MLELKTTKNDYYWAPSTSGDNGYKLYSKRDTNFCFIKNYNPVISKTWLMNIDLQQVYNYHRTLSYMTVYFSKSQNSTSEAMKQIVQNIKQNLLTKAMKKTSMLSSVQDKYQYRRLIYLCLPELWLAALSLSCYCGGFM